MSYPFTFEPASEEEKAERAKLYTGPQSVLVDIVRSKPLNILLPSRFTKIAERIYNMEVRPDDVFMITYPKAGSTWTQEMLWQIVHGFDVEAGKEPIFFRSPFLEMTAIAPQTDAVFSIESDNPMERMGALMADTVGYTERRPKSKGRRVIKTHLPLEMLPPGLVDKCKVVWVNRNPKDSLVSWFNHERIWPTHAIRSDCFDEFSKLYMKGDVLYGDYWAYLKRAWEMKDHPNVKLIWYEDMKEDLKAVVKSVAEFLGETFPDDKLDALIDHLSFDNFKNNDAVNMRPPKGAVPDEVRDNFNFMWKGKVGNWKDQISNKELLDDLDAWVEKNNADDNIPIR